MARREAREKRHEATGGLAGTGGSPETGKDIPIRVSINLGRPKSRHVV
jgi:hypothetical protein